jgi:hypothetical protein
MPILAPFHQKIATWHGNPGRAPGQAAPAPPAETTSPLPPTTGGPAYNYAQFDDLLGDAEPK